MNGPELVREALRLREQASSWMDVDTGWRGALTSGERLAYRMADLADAQLHATLALAAFTAPSVATVKNEDQEGHAASDDPEIHRIVNEVLKGHPTVVYDPDSGERDESRECRCIGCHIARRTGLRALVDVRRDRDPVDLSEPPF